MSEPLVRAEVVEELVREFVSAAEGMGANLLETGQAAKAVSIACAETSRAAVVGWAEDLVIGGGGE